MKNSLANWTALKIPTFLPKYSFYIGNIFMLGSISLFLLIINACHTEIPDPTPPAEDLFFPSINETNWETISPQKLNWKTNSIPELEKLLEENGTRAFILLKDGKIAMEFYYGKRLAINQPFVRESAWYWASAGKTLTAATIGAAQHEGFLSLGQKTSDILGQGWTSIPKEKENLITIRHQLTMTTGLDDGVPDSDDFSAANLNYKADAGSRWAYHNAPYTLLDQVITAATGDTFANYFQKSIGQKIGMTGTWQRIGDNNVYFSDARSMARFGLMILAKGKWKDETILKDVNFFTEMIAPSQTLNQSYGYLWWLNGQSNFMLPGVQTQIPAQLFVNAPEDMVCGLGRDGQYVCVIPSKNIVLVRMGENPDSSLIPFTFLIDIWGELNKIIG